MKKIVRGNDFTLRIPVKKIVNGEQVSFPLTDCTDIAVHVVSQYKRTALPYTIDKESNDVLLADVDGTTLSLGTYALEVTGVSEGANWRSYEYEQFAIVDNNASSDTVFETTQPDGGTNIEDGNGDNANKGCMDVKIEGFAVDTALVVLPPVSARATIIELIANADAAIAAVRETEAAVKASEEVRVESETLRKSAEEQRAESEATRQNAEVEREKADAEREKRVSEAISNTSSAAKTATDAAAVAMETAKQGMNVITEAERVNAELRGNVLVVTDRNGDVSTLDFEQWDLEERVNITITTSVAGVSVKGVSVNVFLNGSSAFTKYTTDADGKVSFAIPRGTMYRIAFQELKGCDPLPSLTYTAALRVRDINVEYKPISDEQASVIVTIDKAENGSVSPFGGVAVTCAIANGDTTTTETDSEGKVTFRVPYNKKYKITAAQKDGYYAFRGVYEKSNVADVAEHNLYFHYYPTTSGVFILDATGAQYTADEWQAAGKTAEEAVLIKLVTQNLANGNNCFGFSPAALQAGYPNKQWCTKSVLFNNIPTTGTNTKDALYYDGYKASKLVREEAQERSLIIPLFSYAYDCTVEMAGKTLHGYVASVGQMYEMNINKTVVDVVINALYGNKAKLFSPLFAIRKWTSAQNKNADGLSFGDSIDGYSSISKASSHMALPVFAC